MQPTPAPTAAADTSAGITYLLAEIGRLDQELKALNKRPLPATEDQVKALIQADKNRPVQVPAAAVVEQLMGKTGELVTKFQMLYTQFTKELESQTTALRQELTSQAAAMRAAARAGEVAARAVQASADAVKLAGEKVREDLPTSVPVRGEVYGFTNEKTMVWTVLGCLLVGAFLYWAVFALFGRTMVSEAAYEQLRVNERVAVKTNAVVFKEGKFYQGQIERYKAKNPKTTDFPVYEPAE